MPTAGLIAGAVEILKTADPEQKVALTAALATAWRLGTLPAGEMVSPPERPARPARPELRQPRDMPKRRAGGTDASRVALLHAIAHIELNALDLVWDLIARFPTPWPGFHDDWVRVADEEAKHHALVVGRLHAYGAGYGDLPAHDGLWQAALATQGDLLARLAVVPLVLEARGLDVTPPMIGSLDRAGDTASADVLRIIYRDEIGHVEIGYRWFKYLCGQQGLEPADTWQSLVRRYYKGSLKQPFNAEARQAAGLSPSFYEPLAGTSTHAGTSPHTSTPPTATTPPNDLKG